MSTINDVFKYGRTSAGCYLSIDTTDSSAIAIVERDDPDWIIQIIRNHRAYLIVRAPDVHLYIGRFNLKRCVESTDGVDYLLESLGMDKNLNSLKKIPDADEILWSHGLERTKKGWLPEGVNIRTLYKNAGVNLDAMYCFHDVEFACDGSTFIPVNSHSELVAKIEEGHPWWSYCTRGPRTRSGVTSPFRCVIVQNDKLIAEANAGYKEVDDATGLPVNKILGVSVWVRYGYRGKGYGKAVASAVTKEIVNIGSVAIWRTSIDNMASIATAKSLGYQVVNYCIGISKSPMKY